MIKETLKQMDYQSRRQMLKHAAYGALGVSVGAGLVGGKTVFAGENVKNGGTAKHVIYCYMAGGMSHIDTWDPKPGTDVAGEFSPLKTKTKGIRISDRLPNLAKQTENMCIIRSMSSSQGAHDRGNYLMHTSYQPLASVKHAGMGPWIHKLTGRINKKLPGSVVIGGMPRGSASGIFGSAYEPVNVGNAEAGLQNAKLSMKDETFSHRRSLLDRLDKNFRTRYPQEKVQAYTRFYDEAVSLISSADVKAFDINREPASVKAKYGDSRFGQGCLLARRLVEAGVRFVEVTSGGWDTHQDNFDKLTDTLLPSFDQGIAALLGDLKSKGMLDDVLVVQTSEFGRTPKINERGGRDHYPKAFSVMLAGGGVKGGQVYGSSNEKGAAPKDNPVTPQQLNATIGKVLGISHKKEVYTKIGRPFNISDNAPPITDIF
jgi:hypothetical protein